MVGLTQCPLLLGVGGVQVDFKVDGKSVLDGNHVHVTQIFKSFVDKFGTQSAGEADSSTTENEASEPDKEEKEKEKEGEKGKNKNRTGHYKNLAQETQ